MPVKMGILTNKSRYQGGVTAHTRDWKWCNPACLVLAKRVSFEPARQIPVMPTEGICARVITGGVLRPGDEIAVA